MTAKKKRLSQLNRPKCILSLPVRMRDAMSSIIPTAATADFGNLNLSSPENVTIQGRTISKPPAIN